MRRGGRMLVLLLAAAACRGGGQRANDIPPAASAPESRGAAAASELAITADGIGSARRGLSLGALRAALPAGIALGSALQDFMVDVSALPVFAGADTLYYLLFPAGTALQDSLPLEQVATLARGARTAEGLGPGVTLSEAARTCGHLTLAYNVNDESREYAQCPALPGTIRLRVRAASERRAFAGSYAGQAEYNTTASYDPAAAIWMVIVDLGAREQYAPPALDSIAAGGD